MATTSGRAEENKRRGGEMAQVPAKKEQNGGRAGAFVAWVNRIGRRNWVIIGAVLLIGLAVWLNWLFLGNTGNDGYAGYDKSAGMSDQDGSVSTDGKGGKTSADDYFATVEVSRKRARDESLEVLQNVLDSKDATEETKNEALAEMKTIATEIEKEANIEALLVSKGFADCVAVMNGNSINVVVRSEGELQNAQIAQINTVVYEQTGIEPANITIVHKN